MWTSTSYSYHKTWLPNHFVPMIATKEQSIIDLDSVEDFPPLNSTSLGVSCNPCPTIFDSPILRPHEVLETSVKLEASVPSVSSEVLTDDSPSPQESASVRPLTKPEPTVQSVPSEIVKDETLSPQEPSSKRSLKTDLTTGTISSNFDNTNLQNFDEISSTAYAEVGPGSVSEISSDSRTESESISEQVNFLKGKFLSTNSLLGVLNSATETLTKIPRTVKENIYFVLDHSSNISKKTNNTRMDHWDNCGIWETTSTSLKTTYFGKKTVL